MAYNDDELIGAPQNVSEEKPPAFEAGKTQLIVINRPKAPLEGTKLKVLLELTGSGDLEDRSPVDLVMVLDVSDSMNKEDKIGKLKIAVQFLIRKLSPIDRLSVVTFSKDSTRLFPLRQITEKSQDEILEMVNAIKAHGATNMVAGLRTGLKILEDRRLNFGRVGAIMLMSDGAQSSRYGDAGQVPVDNFAVYTFGFGSDAKPEVLQKIAEKSKGGTFSDVRNQNDLSKAFSQCLGGLLTVVVQDLKLTVVTEDDQESKITNVSAGNYLQNKNADGSITILFGELYNNEVRLVLVELLLPKVDSERSPDVLQVTYTYSAGKGKRPFEAPPVIATVTRSATATDEEMPKVTLEANRLKALNTVKEARVLADEKNVPPTDYEKNVLPVAKAKVDKTKISLEKVKVEDPTELMKTLIYELQQLSDFMTTQKDYEEKGRPYAMSFETSHERQRYAARGDIDKVRSFATPRMNAYLEQAKKFEEDTTKPPPSEADDVKQDILNDPRIPSYIKLAIKLGKTTLKVGKSIFDTIKDRTRHT